MLYQQASSNKCCKRLVLVPPMGIRAAWEADYAQMSESMIYGATKPTFAEILAQVQILQEKFRIGGYHSTE